MVKKDKDIDLIVKEDIESISKNIERVVSIVSKCLKLCISDDKLDNALEWLDRYSGEFLTIIGDSDEVDFIRSKFSNFISKTLSIVEALGLSEQQYKAVRKLVLSEMNGCLDLIVKNLQKGE